MNYEQYILEFTLKTLILEGKDVEHYYANLLLLCSVIRNDTDLVLFAFESGASLNITLDTYQLDILQRFHYNIPKEPDSVSDVEYFSNY